MRTEVERCTVGGEATQITLLEAARSDLIDAGGVRELSLSEGPSALEVILVPEDPKTS
jgi:valyl-tRNA synthetase